MANIFNQDEQDQLNAAITAASGTDRAFWLGMIEDGAVADKNAAKDSDGNELRFEAFRSDQPSNRLNSPNDKHTVGLNEDCVRQFGLEGWNDAICTRTWSGAKKDNVLMGHICETRTVLHSTQHINKFEDAFVEWIATFLGPTYPQMVKRWETVRIAQFSKHIREILGRNCAAGTADYSGVSSVDPNEPALAQLSTIIADMTTFFGTFIPGCKQAVMDKKVAKLNRFEVDLTAKFNTL